MPSFNQEVEVNATQTAAWRFVRQIGNWASLFPGYQRHLEVDEDNFNWQIRGETGAFSRLVEFEVHVQEWNEPRAVSFELKGKTEPLKGTGSFFLTRKSETTTTMSFNLSVEGQGPTAPMLNGLLKKFLVEQSGAFFDRLAASIAEYATVEEPTDAKVGGEPRAPVEDSALTSVPDRSPILKQQLRTGAEHTPAFPVGPGVIVVEYRAPRTKQFEEWLHGPHYTDLLTQPAVTRVSRFEQIGPSDSLGSYLALIHSSDLATTLRYRTTSGVSEQEAANERGLVRGESYYARVIYDKKLSWPSRGRSRLRQWTRR